MRNAKRWATSVKRALQRGPGLVVPSSIKSLQEIKERVEIAPEPLIRHEQERRFLALIRGQVEARLRVEERKALLDQDAAP